MDAHEHEGGATKASPRATDAFRREHESLRQHLDEIAQRVGSLRAPPVAESHQQIEEITRSFHEHVLPHAVFEERVLYPLIDARAGKGERFTELARHEHRIIERWLEWLEGDGSNPVAFSRQADRLLGLILAHFENEEEVLLPVLDRTMTQEEFEQEVLAQHDVH